MNSRDALVLVASVALCTTACVDRVPLGQVGGLCPCAEGLACDTGTSTCVLRGTADGGHDVPNGQDGTPLDTAGQGGDQGGPGRDGAQALADGTPAAAETSMLSDGAPVVHDGGPGDRTDGGSGDRTIVGGEWVPIPSGTTSGLRGVWGNSKDDVWAVGDSGRILRWRGSAWASVSSGTTNTLFGVWGSSETDVWAVGASGTVLRWRGSAWLQVPSGTMEAIQAVWGSSVSSVWASASQTEVLRWNGSSWVPTGAPGLKFAGIWGSATNDIWMTRYGGLNRWNGSAWSSHLVGPDPYPELRAVWGSSASDVWAVGYTIAGQTVYPARIVRWDSSAWKDYPLPSGKSGQHDRLFGVWGSSGSDVWAVGEQGILRWNGSAWARVETGDYGLRAVWGSSASDVWAVGSGGTILHWNASQ